MTTRNTGGALRPRAPDPDPDPDQRTSSMPAAVKIVAILTARPGKAAELRALLDAMIAPSRGEAGNLRYDLWQDQADPTRFVLDELYVDDAAVAIHRASSHFGTYLAIVGDLAERTAVTLDPASVA